MFINQNSNIESSKDVNEWTVFKYSLLESLVELQEIQNCLNYKTCEYFYMIPKEINESETILKYPKKKMKT